MTAETFVVLAASTAMAILLVVDLRVPFGPLRGWLGKARHVEAQSLAGPWHVVEWDEDTHGWFRLDESGQPTEAQARALLSHRERLHWWLAEMLRCPWCAGGWLSLASTLVLAVARGADVVVFWPAVWFASAALVLVVRRLAD